MYSTAFSDSILCLQQRLFKRLENLRKIISCIERAIPGVANAFGILVLVGTCDR